MTTAGPAPDAQHADRLKGLTFEPVFIIGDHRSGTTVLYQLLSSTGVFNVVTAYHVICYDEIVANHVSQRTEVAQQALAERFVQLGLANRVIDGVRVTPDLPEEYGFVIDQSSRPQLRPQTLPAFIELCRKIRFAGADRPILLKNPWDVLGFAYVKRAVANAKFIFLHRHPLRVMSSQLAAMRSLFNDRNEYVAALSPWYRNLFENPVALHLTRAVNSPRFGFGARVVGRHVTKVARYYRDNIQSLPTTDYIELRYEDLCEDPDSIVQRVMSFLQLEPTRPVAARELVQARAGQVLPEVADRYRKIQPALRDYCATHGYN